MIYFRSSERVSLPVMESGFEPPLWFGLVSSAQTVVVIADSRSYQLVSAVFCFASLSLFACVSPASVPVSSVLYWSWSYIYCTDPLCP